MDDYLPVRDRSQEFVLVPRRSVLSAPRPHAAASWLRSVFDAHGRKASLVAFARENCRLPGVDGFEDAVDAVAQALATGALVAVRLQSRSVMLDAPRVVNLSDLLVDPPAAPLSPPPEVTEHTRWISFELVDTEGSPVSADFTTTIDGRQNHAKLAENGQHTVESLADDTRASVRFASVAVDSQRRGPSSVDGPQSVPSLPSSPQAPPTQSEGSHRVSFEVVLPDGTPAAGSFSLALTDSTTESGALGAPTVLGDVEPGTKPVLSIALAPNGTKDG